MFFVASFCSLGAWNVSIAHYAPAIVGNFVGTMFGMLFSFVYPVSYICPTVAMVTALFCWYIFSASAVNRDGFMRRLEAVLKDFQYRFLDNPNIMKELLNQPYPECGISCVLRSARSPPCVPRRSGARGTSRRTDRDYNTGMERHDAHAL